MIRNSPYRQRKAFFQKTANFKPWMSSGIFEAHISKVPKRAYRVFISQAGSPLNPAPEILADYEAEYKACPDGFHESDKRPTAWTFAKCEQRYKDQILNDPDAMAELRRLELAARTQPVFVASLAWTRPDYRYVLLDIIYDYINNNHNKRH